MGLRRSTTKFSARIIMKRVNLWQRIFSISSACLTAMLMRTEFTLLSIKTRSFSLRDMTTGVKISSSLLRTSTSGLLCRSTTCDEKLVRHMAAFNVCRTAVKYGFNVADIVLLARRFFDYHKCWARSQQLYMGHAHKQTVCAAKIMFVFLWKCACAVLQVEKLQIEIINFWRKWTILYVEFNHTLVTNLMSVECKRKQDTQFWYLCRMMDDCTAYD